MYKRNLLEKFVKWINREEILILIWARQVWKTSFLKGIFQKNISSEKKIFLNLENFSTLKILNEDPENLIKLIKEEFWLSSLEKISGEKFFVFIDEIQYLKNPTNFLKFIFDEFKDNIKLIVSWSSAFYIDKNFKDSLSWRKKIFELNPLSFDEFLIFKEEDNLIKNLKNYSNLTENTRKKIDNFFDEYFIFWWYPKVILEKDLNIKKELVWEIINSYLKKDINEFNLKYPEKLYEIYKILSFQIGNIINKKELSNTLNMSLNAVENYIYLLRKSFHLKTIKPFFWWNIRKELTKSQKVFILDFWIRNYLENNWNSLENRVDKWWLFENIFFNHLKIKYQEIFYWRTVDWKEVDFVIPSEKKAIEIKFKSKTQKLKNLEYFCEKNNFKWYVIDRDNFFEFFYKN